jgi:hypothetical protein
MSNQSQQQMPKIDPEELRKAVSVSFGKILSEEEFKKQVLDKQKDNEAPPQIIRAPESKQ